MDVVDKANQDAPAHSRIMHQMVYMLPFNEHLVTTDKGTVIRKRSLDKFQNVVDRLYKEFLEGPARPRQRRHSSVSTWSEADAQAYLADAISQVLDKDRTIFTQAPQESLFEFGLNSLLAIQLRNIICEAFGNVPTNFIFEHPTLETMARALVKSNFKSDEEVQEEHYQETQNILQDYIERAHEDFPVAKPGVKKHEQHVVLLTGATGSLGSFMLRDMLKSPRVKKVVCLVRGKPDQLFQRLQNSFKSRRLDVSLLDSKIEVLPMDLNAPDLGFDKATYDRLHNEVTIVQACHWLLDFNQPVSHFERECIRGLYNLLKFSFREEDPMHVHAISSVSATAAMGVSDIPETYPKPDPHSAMPMGYAQSKYICEQLFNYLTQKKSKCHSSFSGIVFMYSHFLDFPCITERMGQVCGDTVNGVWNTSEQYPLLIVGGGSVMHKVHYNKSTQIYFRLTHI